jgi:hypothetical protein
MIYLRIINSQRSGISTLNPTVVERSTGSSKKLLCVGKGDAYVGKGMSLRT